ncbi:MAG TPA: hypothetical protein VFT99_02525, partial [Roseiflexaceae bacterium]|nr:hypothetical protein [Roseiflexaceae bacterium]
ILAGKMYAWRHPAEYTRTEPIFSCIRDRRSLGLLAHAICLHARNITGTPCTNAVVYIEDGIPGHREAGVVGTPVVEP